MREQSEKGQSVVFFPLLSALGSSCCAVQVGGVRTSPCVLVYLVYMELEMDLVLWMDGN